MLHAPSPDEIRATLDRILPTVEKPSRYLGLERNLIRKPWQEVAVRMALAFPDAYEIGMSHQGTRILYHLVNRRSDALAERCFAPLPDMAAALRAAGLPLYTLESYRPVGSFDVVGISLQSELNYSNLPYLLDLAGITRRAARRSDDEPIVLGGGPCTANPEPIADFFDALLIGDAEPALDAIVDVIRDGRRRATDRGELLRSLSAIRGVYVPGLYQWRPGDSDGPASWQALAAGAALPVSRVWVDRLDPADSPELPIVPFADVIQDRLGLEIMRGCSQGCRFCQAGYWYRPVREHDPETVLDRIERQVAETGFEEVGLLSLSSADYSQIEPLVYHLADRMSDRRVSVSLPSLRADAFSVGLAEAVSRVRRSGFTFAPETGSDRLRRVINKTFTNHDMIIAAEAAFAAGWPAIKVYAMVGLPTETDDDLEELARLADQLARTGRRIAGRRVEVKVSLGCFVPKAQTPFQWQPFGPVAELERRIGLIRDRFRRIRGARLTWSEPEEAALEALLARGDRALSTTIERAHDLGAKFDGWSDHLNLPAWRQAIASTGVDLDRELGPRDPGAPLPWDVIDSGVRKGFLRAESRRAVRGIATEDCKWGHCFRCGIPGDGQDTRLATSSLPLVGEEVGEAERPKAAVYRLRAAPRRPPPRPEPTQPPVFRRYRFTFSKAGDARFLSHRQVMDALERVLRGAAVPVRYTQGYNPHVRISMAPPLAVGHEGEAELADIDCTAPVRPFHIATMNRLLPEGVTVRDACELVAGAPSLGKLIAAARYRIGAGGAGPWPGSTAALPEQLRGGVIEWTVLPDGTLCVELNQRPQDGPAISAQGLLVALGLSEREARRVRVVRERLLLRPASPDRGPAGSGRTSAPSSVEPAQ